MTENDGQNASHVYTEQTLCYLTPPLLMLVAASGTGAVRRVLIMLLYALITLTLLSFGTIVGFFALQGKVRAFRLASVERSARARWSRMTAAQKSQALKKIGVFTLRNAPSSALDLLFDGIMMSARETLARDGDFDFQALNDELDRALAPVGAASKGHLAHG